MNVLKSFILFSLIIIEDINSLKLGKLFIISQKDFFKIANISKSFY